MGYLIRKVKSLYNKITANQDLIGANLVGRPEQYQLKQDFQINFLKEQGLKVDHTFLDIGCGVLRGGLPVISYLNSFKYYGIDIRKESLEIGAKLVKKNKISYKNPTLILSDKINELQFDVKFDVIWAFSVLFHLNENNVEEVFNLVSRYISNKGVFYANVNIGERDYSKWQNFPVVWRSIEFYINLGLKYNLFGKDIGKLEDYGHKTGQVDDEQRILVFKKK